MTLKAAVIYIQGSSGNLLARTLALHPDTIPYVDRSRCSAQPTLNLTEEERLDLYNNWNSNDWITTERSVLMCYRNGLNDFHHYADSKLHLIAQFHPCEFQTEHAKQILWQNISDWQNIIMIDVDTALLPMVMKMASRKRPDLSHNQQIKNHELVAFASLTQQIPNAFRIKWQDILHRDKFLEIIDQLCVKLNLSKISSKSIISLHDAWSRETQLLMK